MKRFAGLVGWCALVVALAAGCGQKNPLLQPNQPPEVELFAQKMGATGYRLQWVGHDPDGTIDHYLYALGSPGMDPRTAAWTSTTEREHVLGNTPRRAEPGRAAFAAAGPSVFSVRAVDTRGAQSTPAQLALFDGTLAPRVEILSPPPNPLIRYPVSQRVCVEWAGSAFDDDSAAARVAEYKYKLLSSTTEVTAATARANPDSVRRYYAPRGWPGWVSRPGPITSAILDDLAMDQEYVFAITCFDRAGNYDPIFSFSRNMLFMRVSSAAAPPPVIGIFSHYVQTSGGGIDSPTVINIEVPASSRPLTFDWSATAAPGRQVTGYRWALDLENPNAHGNAAGHWSPWDLATTSATIGPFNSAETHALYIEARDDWGCSANDAGIGLLIVNITVVKASYSRDLLIVDDTRLLLDRINPGTTCDAAVNRPIGNWPTQAELDTFLYARGGVPWKCYPVGTLSTPGIFHGYSFDTLGTNLRMLDLTVRLSRLRNYRHVLWLTDGAAALNSRPGTDTGDINGPQTSMRYMNSATTTNMLADYVRLGGQVWLAGGGTATASLINFNQSNNDNVLPNPRTLTFSNPSGELVAGRFVYDQAHWRSELKLFKVPSGRIRRYLGRFESAPGIYAGLPPEIHLKSSATDPFPPNRTGQAPAVFYPSQFDVEFLSASNEILEDVDPGRTRDFESALDTLYKATSPALQPDTGPAALQSVVMTYYRGLENPPFVFTGFNLWNFQRSDCVTLVDFVLQRLWGMAPQAPVAAAPAGTGAATPMVRIETPPRVAAGAASRGVARRE